MRIFVNTRVIHLESLTLLRLYGVCHWLRADMLKNPSHKEANSYKIKLVNKEIARRDLLPLTPNQKKRALAALKGFE